VHIQYIYICTLHTYISVQHIYLLIYFSHNKNVRITSIVFGTVHSDMTGVVLLCTNTPCFRLLAFMLCKHLAVFFNSISNIMNCTYTTMSESNITATVNNLFSFSNQLITYNFSSTPIVFCQFFTWIALGDVHLNLSHTLATTANAVEEKTK